MVADCVTKLIVSRFATMVCGETRRQCVDRVVATKIEGMMVNEAYRVPGANEVLNADLQTGRVFRLVLFLRSRHLKSLALLPCSNYHVDDDAEAYGVGSGFGG